MVTRHARVCTGARCARRDAVACCMSHRCLQVTYCTLAWMSHVARNHVVLKLARSHARTHAHAHAYVRTCVRTVAHKPVVDRVFACVVRGLLRRRTLRRRGRGCSRTRATRTSGTTTAHNRMGTGKTLRLRSRSSISATQASSSWRWHASAQPADKVRRMAIALREVQQASAHVLGDEHIRRYDLAAVELTVGLGCVPGYAAQIASGELQAPEQCVTHLSQTPRRATDTRQQTARTTDHNTPVPTHGWPHRTMRCGGTIARAFLQEWSVEG